MLFHRKMLCMCKEIILKVLWVLFCVVVIVVTIVLLSTILKEATFLRNWRNETVDYITIAPIVNASVFKKFFEFPNSNSWNNTSSNNISKNYTVTVLSSGIGLYEPVTESSPDFYSKFGNNKTEEEKCKASPAKDDFSKCGSRVADRKCCEYIWAWKHKDELMEHYGCGDYGIIGGETAVPGHFPHMVAVGFRRLNTTKNMHPYSYKCGGSLISERFVLTAAHCTHLGFDQEHEKVPEVVAMGGEYILEKMQIMKISQKIYKHKKYKSPKHDYDIALLKLLTPVDFTYKIHPACLSTGWHPQYTEVNVTGWGTTDSQDTTHMTENLQVATLHLINRSTCKTLTKSLQNRNFKVLLEHQFCAGMLNKPIDTCRGDSGGPLQVRINEPYGNIHRIIGVTSFGKFCAAKIPSVYVNVTALLPWIEKIVWPDELIG